MKPLLGNTSNNILQKPQALTISKTNDIKEKIYKATVDIIGL